MFFCRMLRKRVPILRLGSRVQQVNKSRCVCVRNPLQAFASVAHSWQSKMVVKRRTVATFGLSCYKSVNSRRDPGGSRSHNAALSSLLDLRVTGIAGVLVAQRRTVGTVGLVFGQLMPRLSVKVLRAPSPRAGCCPAHLPLGLLLTPRNGSKTMALKEPLMSREPALALGPFALGPAMHGWAKVFLLQYYPGPCCWPPASEKGPTALLPLVFGAWQPPYARTRPSLLIRKLPLTMQPKRVPRKTRPNLPYADLRLPNCRYCQGSHLLCRMPPLCVLLSPVDKATVPTRRLPQLWHKEGAPTQRLLTYSPVAVCRATCAARPQNGLEVTPKILEALPRPSALLTPLALTVSTPTLLPSSPWQKR